MKPSPLVTPIAAFFLSLGFLSLIAFAQDPQSRTATTTVYRQILPEGGVLYSDKIQPGARLDQEIRIRLPPVQSSGGSSTAGNSAAAAGAGEDMPSDRDLSSYAAQARVEQAQAALEQARRRQREGTEPLPGERTGTAFNRSRLNEVYAERQQKLAQEVASAEAALKQAIEQRDALAGVR